VTALAPLRHRDFRLLWIGLFVSNTGSWMQFVATGYLVDRLTLSPVYLGVLALAQAIPRLVFAPIGGVVADRVNRQALLVWTNLLLAASALLLAGLAATGRATVWHVVLLGGLNSLLMSFDMPARHALVPELVEEEEVLQAVTLNSVAFNGAGVLGPSLGGVVIAWAGEAACFAVNALTYGAVVAAVLRMHLLPQASASGSVSEDLVDALRALREDRTLLEVLGAVAVLNFFGRPYFRLMPAFAREVLHADAAQLGLLQAAPGVGTVLSAWYVARFGAGQPHRLMTSSAVLFGLSVSLFALSARPWVCLGFLVASGLFQSAAMAAANTLLQTRVDPRMRGRAMGLYSVTAFGMFTLGTFPMGLLSAAIGTSHALALGGLLTVLLILGMGRGRAPQTR